MAATGLGEEHRAEPREGDVVGTIERLGLHVGAEEGGVRAAGLLCLPAGRFDEPRSDVDARCRLQRARRSAPARHRGSVPEAAAVMSREDRAPAEGPWRAIAASLCRAKPLVSTSWKRTNLSKSTPFQAAVAPSFESADAASGWDVDAVGFASPMSSWSLVHRRG